VQGNKAGKKEGAPWKKEKPAAAAKVSLVEVMAGETVHQEEAAAAAAAAAAVSASVSRQALSLSGLSGCVPEVVAGFTPSSAALTEAAQLPAAAKANWTLSSSSPAPALADLMHAEGEEARLEAEWKAKLAQAWAATAKPKTSSMEGIQKKAVEKTKAMAGQAPTKSTTKSDVRVEGSAQLSPEMSGNGPSEEEEEEEEEEGWLDCDLDSGSSSSVGASSVRVGCSLSDGWDRVECRGADLGIFDPRKGWFRVGNEGEWIAVGNKKAAVGKARAVRALTNEEKQLFEACEVGDLQGVKDALRLGADPTALKSEDASRFHGALPAGFFYERLMPLMVACEGGQLAVVQYLVETAKVDPSEATPTGLTPLIAACQSANASKMVKYLVNAGVKPEEADGHGFSALWVACRNGDLPLVKYLTEEAGVDINKAGDPHRGSGLMAAAAHGHLAVVGYLLEQGANVGHKDIFGEDALSSAVAMQQGDVVACLGQGQGEAGGVCSIM